MWYDIILTLWGFQMSKNQQYRPRCWSWRLLIAGHQTEASDRQNTLRTISQKMLLRDSDALIMTMYLREPCGWVLLCPHTSNPPRNAITNHRGRTDGVAPSLSDIDVLSANVRSQRALSYLLETSGWVCVALRGRRHFGVTDISSFLWKAIKI